jgi:hypothetical protein
MLVERRIGPDPPQVKMPEKVVLEIDQFDRSGPCPFHSCELAALLLSF